MTAQYVLSYMRVVDANGNPISGAQLEAYEAGTSTPLDTYADAALSIENSVPVEADSSGLFGAIFLAVDNYKFILKDGDGNIIFTQDNYEVSQAITFTGGLENTGAGVVRITKEYNNVTATNYTMLDGDRGKFLTFSNVNDITVTLPTPTSSSFESGWFAEYKNIGSGNLIFTSSENINGSSSDFTSFSGEGGEIHCDNSDYTINSHRAGGQFSSSAGELTVSSGEVTVTGGASFTLDTEGDASTDDLDTINGGSTGDIITVGIEDSARNVVLKDGTGNLSLGFDITLDTINDQAVLRYNGTNWNCLAKFQETIEAASLELGGIEVFPGGVTDVDDGAEGSVTLQDGTTNIVIKYGLASSVGAGSNSTVTYATAMPSNTRAAFATQISTTDTDEPALVSNLSASGFTVRNSASAARSIYWLAVGD